MTDHKAIGDSELHELKGAAGAAAGTVPVADGAGNSAWGTAPYKYILQAKITDVSTAETVYIPVPITGTITKIYSALGAAITSADATITTKVGVTTVTDGALTIAYSGSAAGDVDSATPSANNAVTAGGYVSVATDGASTTTAPLIVTLVISVS